MKIGGNDGPPTVEQLKAIIKNLQSQLDVQPVPLTPEQLQKAAVMYCTYRDAQDGAKRRWADHMETAACMDAWRCAFKWVLE